MIWAAAVVVLVLAFLFLLKRRDKPKKNKLLVSLGEDCFSLKEEVKISGVSRVQAHMEGTPYSFNEIVAFVVREEGVYAVIPAEEGLIVGFGKDEEAAQEKLVRSIMEVAYFDNESTPLHRYLKKRMLT